MSSGYRNYREDMTIPSRGGGLKPRKEILEKYPLYKRIPETAKKFYHLSTVKP